MGERAARWVGLIFAHDSRLKLCSRPSSRRSVTDMPKDALLLSSEALTTSVLARRALSSGFLARPLRRRSCRRSLAPRGAQLQNG
jgi:hypothetical protein